MALLAKSFASERLMAKIIVKSKYRNLEGVSVCVQNFLRHYAEKSVKRKQKNKLQKKKESKTNLEDIAVVAEDKDSCPKFSENACFNFSDNLSAVLYGTGDLRLEQKQLPKYGEKEVLIATECVGLSKSDLGFVSKGKFRDSVLEKPIILGHEATGTIAEVGTKVTKFRPGDRVAIEPLIPCKICDFCKKGRFNLCSNLYFCGIPPSNGTLSRFFAWPEDFCLKLPHHVGFDEAALLEPLAIAHHACKRGGVTVGSKVLICGAGPMGLLNMLCARACGATNIVVTDNKSDRLRCANNMGANTIIFIKKSTKEECLIEEISEALCREAHVCLECSGSPQAIRVATEVTMAGGTIVLVGVSSIDTAVRTKCTTKEVDIRGVRNYCNNFQNALDLIATGRLDFRSMISHDFKLNDILEAIDVAKSNRAIKILIHTNPKWIPTRKRNY